MKKTFKSEKDVKAAVKELLAGTPRCWWYMPSAAVYGRQGCPDFIGCVDGQMFAIETKFAGGKPTVMQEREMALMTVAGAIVWVVNEKNIDEWRADFVSWVPVC